MVARFERLYAEHGRAVLAYAVRRSIDAQDGADVVAETFLVAWRRLDDVPPGEAARLWLYGVARRVLANRQRSERRRERLAERLRRELPAALEGVPPPGPETSSVQSRGRDTQGHDQGRGGAAGGPAHHGRSTTVLKCKTVLNVQLTAAQATSVINAANQIAAVAGCSL